MDDERLNIDSFEERKVAESPLREWATALRSLGWTVEDGSKTEVKPMADGDPGGLATASLHPQRTHFSTKRQSFAILRGGRLLISDPEGCAP